MDETRANGMASPGLQNKKRKAKEARGEETSPEVTVRERGGVGNSESEEPKLV